MEPWELARRADVLDTLPDPRRRQGRRYRLGVLLSLCTLAVLGGAPSLIAIARSTAGLRPETRSRLGLGASAPPAPARGDGCWRGSKPTPWTSSSAPGWPGTSDPPTSCGPWPWTASPCAARAPPPTPQFTCSRPSSTVSAW
ncbi:transposase family protein (plasmid) [Streptomyces sp. QH1-20]|uniref:transposase family protein n=1 Tax=Streptomyces sp. QH1-20 TaxID=3240934 RepID=UPI00351795BD